MTLGTTAPTACTVIPPYLLEALARNGTPAQREYALRTLSVDSSHRTQRVQASLLAASAARAAAPRAAAATPVPHRTIYDARGTENLPGTLVRAEGGAASTDDDVNLAYDGLGATFGFFQDVLDRDSIDDRGMALIASVHVGQKWDNAQWDGHQMQFGDGDGEVFGHFTRSLDVIGHELTHGVTQYEAQLVYQAQSGALNESMSDVFGSMVKQYHLGQTTEQADWLIGADLVLPTFHGVALRSMKAPGTAYDDPNWGADPQPASMAGYVHTRQDNGGVHINSGIPNRAFYLVAAQLGGNSWDQAGPIWYAALRDPRLKPNATFAAFAKITVRAARTEFGETQAKVVREAWHEVGVRVVR